MKLHKKLLSGFLGLVLALTPLFYFPKRVSGEIATEFYSEDIFEALPTAAVPENDAKLNIKAKAAVLMEPNTGKILYSQNKDEKLAPASITKIMSLLLVMEAIENEKISPETVVAASEHAASMGGSQIWLEPGETMTVDELLRASVIASANDATVALAEAIAGSEEAFVELMNKRAKELGMKNTAFKNACGLDTEGHLTTANDVAIMASALIKHDRIKKYSTVWMDALRNGKSELVNTNKLVRYYKGATGLKTGTTSLAGCCVAATAQRDGLELVAVIMGGESSKERFAGASKLLDYGFAGWSYAVLTPDITKLREVKVKGGMTELVTPEVKGEIKLLLKKGKDKKAEQVIKIATDLAAPVNIGDKIGSVIFAVEGEKVGELPIVAASRVEKVGFFSVLLALMGEVFVN